MCERRDVKGLYKMVRAGEIEKLTGITDPYEAPEHPDLDINTEKHSIDQCVNIILKKLIDDDIITQKNKYQITESLIETVSDEDLAYFKTLKSIDIDIE
jgi:hypothetical protein